MGRGALDGVRETLGAEAALYAPLRERQRPNAGMGSDVKLLGRDPERAGSLRERGIDARVATQDQNLELEREALTKARCRKVFEDKMRGTRAARP